MHGAQNIKPCQLFQCKGKLPSKQVLIITQNLRDKTRRVVTPLMTQKLYHMYQYRNCTICISTETVPYVSVQKLYHMYQHRNCTICISTETVPYVSVQKLYHMYQYRNCTICISTEGSQNRVGLNYDDEESYAD
jgi:hypothetical protein